MDVCQCRGFVCLDANIHNAGSSLFALDLIRCLNKTFASSISCHNTEKKSLNVTSRYKNSTNPYVMASRSQKGTGAGQDIYLVISASGYHARELNLSYQLTSDPNKASGAIGDIAKEISESTLSGQRRQRPVSTQGLTPEQAWRTLRVPEETLDAMAWKFVHAKLSPDGRLQVLSEKDAETYGVD